MDKLHHDINYTADQINFVNTQLSAINYLMSQSNEEEIVRLSFLFSPIQRQLYELIEFLQKMTEERVV